tara:strand:+ start:2236 stop:2670 length:435 start_codon:yes stop_codon:yes gene_type:complete
VGHKPKAELARDMLVRALDSGVTARWVTGDAVYGESFQLRWALEERGQGYVMAVSRKTHVWLGLKQRKVGYLLATLQANTEFGWARLSAGAGSQGPRLSDWVFLAINPGPFDGWQRGMLVRTALLEWYAGDDGVPHFRSQWHVT